MPSLTLTSDTGPSSSDLVTSQSGMVAIVQPGVLASIYVDGVPTLAIMPDGTGNISFDAGLDRGQHVVTVWQGGSIVASLAVTITNAYTANTYLEGFLNLLPSGPAWPKNTLSTMSRVSRTLVKTFARNAGRAQDLLTETFPNTTRELLPEWEASLGLIGDGSDLSRRQAVVAQLIGVTGPSISSLTLFASLLGYSITIEESSTLRPGVSTMPASVGGPYTPYTWIVTAPVSAKTSLLSARLSALAPSHTILVFNYV